MVAETGRCDGCHMSSPTPCPHSDSSNPNPPSPGPGQRNGVTITPTLEEPPREGSPLSPAMSSSWMLSLLPSTQVTPELLFKINGALALCQALGIISGSPCHARGGKGFHGSMFQMRK